MRRQHLFNSFPLCWIEKFAAIGMGCSLLFGQNRLDGILASLHMSYRRQFRSDGLAGGELPPCFMLLTVNDLELTAAVPLIEVPANLLICLLYTSP